jgi:hypothetical protein
LFLLLAATLFVAGVGTLGTTPAPASANSPAAAAAADSPAPPVELGHKYYVRSRLDWNKCAEIPGASKKNSTQADIWTCVNQDNVKWVVTSAGAYAGINTYFIKNAHSGKCLNVAGYSIENGAKIIQYTCSSQLNGRWRFVARNGGYWELWNMGTSGFINIAGGKATNGAKLIQWTKSGFTNEEFFFDLA